MLEPHPPRREPRLALLRAARGLLTFAVVDPWELRGVGGLPERDPVATRLALEAVVHQTRPTVLALLASGTHGALLAVVRAVAARRALPMLQPTREDEQELRTALQGVSAELLATVPELASVEDRRLRQTALLARAALFTLSIPPRSYVSRLASPPQTSLDPPRSRRARAA